MNAQPECILCLFNQALNTVRAVTDDRSVWTEVLQRLARQVPDIDLAQPPAAVSQNVYTLIAEISGQHDPFAEHKQTSNTIAFGNPGFPPWVISGTRYRM